MIFRILFTKVLAFFRTSFADDILINFSYFVNSYVHLLHAAVYAREGIFWLPPMLSALEYARSLIPKV